MFLDGHIMQREGHFQCCACIHVTCNHNLSLSDSYSWPSVLKEDVNVWFLLQSQKWADIGTSFRAMQGRGIPELFENNVQHRVLVSVTALTFPGFKIQNLFKM